MTCESCASPVDRRTFLKFMVGGAAGAAFGPQIAALAQETTARTRAKACILLWMAGGPSQLDTWDPKPGRKNGGEFRAIATSAKGMQISEHLPRLGEQARHFSIVRSLTTGEAAHERGAYLMHTGYAPIGGLPFAPVGTIASHELSRADFPLPTFVSMNAPVPLSPIFGERHLPFTVQDVNNPIPNLRPGVGTDRAGRRADLLRTQDEAFEVERRGKEIQRRHESAKKAQDLMTTPLLRAFDLSKEPDAVRKAYGDNFGQMCLLARRLVEVGVPFVEVGLGGWDTHDNNFEQVKNLSARLDAGFGSLMKDLVERDLLRDTLVLWAGEFGRTPEINAGNGRDHWTKCWSVVMAGAGIQGGRVIGETDKDGMEIRNRPVTVPDYFATIFKSLGIDPEKKYVLSGRKVKYAYNGKPIRELF